MNFKSAKKEAAVVLTALLLGLTACAGWSTRNVGKCGGSVYNSWGCRLGKMEASEEFYYSQDNISLLLGKTPNRCEALVESGWRTGMAINERRVTKVLPNSPAEKAGIRPGYVINSINGKPVSDLKGFGRGSNSDRRKIVVLGTDSGVFRFHRALTKVTQCYWEIGGGAISTSSGQVAWGQDGRADWTRERGGGWTQERGGGSFGSSSRTRFFRATCRFQDEWLMYCEANWQN